MPGARPGTSGGVPNTVGMPVVRNFNSSILKGGVTKTPLPTDYAGLVAWHEACNEPGGEGSAVDHLVGVGGMPYGPRNTTVSQQPTIVTLGSGRRAYRFDGVDDMLQTTAVLINRPFTIIWIYGASSAAASDRRVLQRGSDNTGGDWLSGPRSSGTFALYNGAQINGPATDLVVRVHSIRQNTSGTLAEYRVDGVLAGTNSNINTPGTVQLGNPSGEPAYADILGFIAYNVALSDVDLAAIEAYWTVGCGGITTPSTNRLTQEVIESVAGAVSSTKYTQDLIEAVTGANSNTKMTQFVIEVAIPVGKGPRFWGTVIYGS